MRRRTFYLVGTVSFLCWAAILCYLFVHKPLGKGYRYKDILNQVQVLEDELKSQLQKNALLLEQLKSVKKAIDEKHLDIKQKLDQLDLDKRVFEKKFEKETIAVLLFACNRVTVKRSLDQLLEYRPDHESFPIIVSQDCNHEPTRRVLMNYVRSDQIKLIRHNNTKDIPLTGKEKKFKGYYKISRHYGWALNQTFHQFNYQTVIIVEDDLDIAPDFFEYFRALYPVLKRDPTLWCISAWNDNGKPDLTADDPTLLHRSDFFPGLGWMLTKDVWLELQSKWPKAFWDDWVRQPEQRRNRSCIRPEISRTRTFGKIGVSNGLFFDKHLRHIRLNQDFVPFKQLDLTHLIKETYDAQFDVSVKSSYPVTISQLVEGNIRRGTSLRVIYTGKDDFKQKAKRFGLMDDFKSGVPRTGYRGVVSFMYKDKQTQEKRRIYLAPPAGWKGYDTSWN